MFKIKNIGLQPYNEVFTRMREFTANRDETTADEIWLCQHPPVFTQGRHGKAEHILDPHNIPVVQTDRGGQVTYHGPGQLVVYFMIDLKRAKLGIKTLVNAIENMVITTLADFNITATTKESAPGVYVNDKKICSIGLCVKRGCTYHGIALNIDMDLTPFKYINPCGYIALKMCQVSDFNKTTFAKIEKSFIKHLSEFKYDHRFN